MTVFIHEVHPGLFHYFSWDCFQEATQPRPPNKGALEDWPQRTGQGGCTWWCRRESGDGHTFHSLWEGLQRCVTIFNVFFVFVLLI